MPFAGNWGGFWWREGIMNFFREGKEGVRKGRELLICSPMLPLLNNGKKLKEERNFFSDSLNLYMI